ncbi:hypothetical protein [Roseibium sp.]|uniref:hypothetical protein n=1 Tax=Roseibium sp. TaxID=1936156 RepID=UPI003A97EDD6
MHHLINCVRAIGLAAVTGLAIGFVDIATAHAKSTAQQTVMLEEDSLAVTIASASLSEADPLNSDLTIWVGEIELHGRNTIWVELIDGYGEVIYDSEVQPNETHLLPDGRAVVVRSISPDTRIAKLDESRIESDATLMVTRRVVEEGDAATSVEFVEPAKAVSPSRVLELAAVGEALWAAITEIFETAATRVQVAWNWIVDTVRV